jgi:tetratricopeptide (TPR) repeat protein
MHKRTKTSNPPPAKSSSPTPPRPAFPAWLVAVLLALGTLVLYWPATQNDFVNMDDPEYVTANVHVQSGLTSENVRWAFTSFVSSNWHPLTMLSHMLDCQLFGLKPFGHHLTNVLLHALNTALLFLLLRQLTGALWRCAAVAALFAAHPLHVESVAWVAERKDVLSTFFGLLSIFCYAKAVTGDKDSSRITRHLSLYWLSLLFFALSLMSKSMLVTLPCILLLLDHWPLRRISGFRIPDSGLKSLLLEKIPFFLLAAAVCVVTLIAQKSGGAVITVVDYPLGDRLENVMISYCRYLGKIFWPSDLGVFYPHAEQWPFVEVISACVLLCGITALFYLARRRYASLLVGWLWFVGTLVPVIGLVQVGKQAIADRYTYIPSIGLFILVVWGLYELTKSWRHHVIASPLAASTAIILCLAITRQQLGYWKDSETLFRHTLNVTVDNFVINYNLGVTLYKKGQANEAMEQFEEAVRLAPNYADAHVNFGVALLDQGRIDEAISQFQEAVRLKSENANAHVNLGSALLKKARLDEAITEFQKAINVKPDDADAQLMLAKVLALKQKFDSLASNPGAMNNLAWELATSPDAKVRNGPLAVEMAEAACKATGYRVTIMIGTLAAAYAEAGRFEDAVATGQKACALASQMGDTNLLKRNQDLVVLYQSRQPYHESGK